MDTMGSRAFQVTQVYGHNSVPHNEEAYKLAKAGAEVSRT